VLAWETFNQSLIIQKIEKHKYIRNQPASYIIDLIDDIFRIVILIYPTAIIEANLTAHIKQSYQVIQFNRRCQQPAIANQAAGPSLKR
jgi:hypothetical protein